MLLERAAVVGRLRAVLSLALAACAGAGWSQSGADASVPLRFYHLTVDNGLSNSWVRSTLRDSRGFLWIATLGGIDRYDGGRFVHYTHVATDAHSLASAEAWSLFEDSRQRLWVGAGGLHLYDRDNDRFERHAVERAPGTGERLIIRVIRADRQGHIWLGTEAEGLVRYDADRRVSKRFAHAVDAPGSLSDDKVVGLACDRRGRLWAGTQRGLDLFDEQTETFVHVFAAADMPEHLRRATAVGLSVESVHEARDGTLWLGTIGAGLIHFDPETRAVQQFLPNRADPRSLGAERVLAVTSDEAGTVYVGVENQGLDVLAPGAAGFIHYRPDRDDPTSLASPSIWSLSFDTQGLLWLGTYNAGLDSLSPFGRPFGLLSSQRGGLSDPHVMAVLEDHAGDLWIGTDGGGLNHFDRKSGRFSYYRHDPWNPKSLGSDAVLSLLEDRQHNIWIGTWAGGLHRLDPRTGRLDRFPRAPDLPLSLGEWRLAEDRHGRLLVGLQGPGVEVFDPDTGTYTPLARSYPGVGQTGNASGIFAIVVDQQGNLWLGGNAGLEFVETSTGRITRYPVDPAGSAVAAGAVYAVFPDSRGNVWIGTEGGGLTCLEAGTRSVRRYGKTEGLPDDTVGDIQEDEDGNLWLGTTHGLAKFEDGVRLPAQPHFRNFGVVDGLQGGEFRHGASFRSRGGEMFFGGQRGLSRFFPRQVVKNPVAPQVVFTGLRVFGNPAEIGAPGSPLTRSITESGELTLSHEHSVLGFDFAALNFIVPEKNQYEYMLEGLDPSWRRAVGLRTANYTSLPPGSYVLRVRASNNDGVWNAQGAALRLRVTPPFWGTLPFRLALVLAALGLVLVGHRLRVRRIRSYARELEAKVEERTQDLNHEIAERVRLNQHLERRAAEVTQAHAEVTAANQELEAFAYSVSHDLRAPLRAIDGFSRLMSTEMSASLDDEGRRMLGLVRSNAQHMGQLIDDLLAFSRLGRKDLVRTRVDMQALVRSVWEELQKQASAPLPVLELRALEPAWCDANMVRQVLVNLLSNAVKFSAPVSSPVVEVGQQADGAQTVYYVKDNGVGFDMHYADKLFGVFQRLHSADEFEGTGVGLAIVERVVRRHGGKVWGQGQVGAGATFSFSLPHAAS